MRLEDGEDGIFDPRDIPELKMSICKLGIIEFQVV